MDYLKGKKSIKLGRASYVIAFSGRQIIIRAISAKRSLHAPYPAIGNATYHIQGDTVMFDSVSISHRSPSVVKGLAEAVEAIFKEANPKVAIRGHGTWLRKSRPPVPFSFSGPRRSFPRRPRQKPRPI
ncbi:MAG: hypothetical protein PHD95_02540 [Candidatus ainarchaeum sp.]|nr:hypothetical protein [Candidatus ainarchaeum sp.]